MNTYKVQMYINGTENDAIFLRKSLAQTTYDEYELGSVFGVSVELESPPEEICGVENDTAVPEDETIIQQIFDVVESALTLAGFEVMDDDRYSFIIRHGASDTDYEIKVNELG